MTKLIRLLNTVKYLKPIQVYHRLYYFARRRIRNIYGFKYPLTVTSKSVPLRLQSSISSYHSVNDKTFTFLNLSHNFSTGIEWNYAEFGKLWTYNLTYFDFLQQDGMSKEEGLILIHDFIEQSGTFKDALEPFPISLRGINWVKFLVKHEIRDQKIDDSLYAQYRILMDNLEYHLLGNHLLENGFSLLFGAYYFQDVKLYAKAKEILVKELDEQILDDGAHFELSPMYHQIMLFRVLDCLNLLQNNQWVVHGGSLMALLEEKASAMLGWLNAMTFENGNIPLFNDSARGIAPTTVQLNAYALTLNSTFKIQHSTLMQSGYRKITKPHYECIIDVGTIGPDYIPGHAHADTFNFELCMDGKPFIVDTGLSTYETNTRRTTERGTVSHNTVEVSGADSSEVWGAFRVAERAYVAKLEEGENSVIASHDGYLKKFGIVHTREWAFKEEIIIINDTLNKKAKAIARFHFHPSVTKEIILKHISIQNSACKIQHYSYAPEFNQCVEALVMEISFEDKLEMEIKI